MAGRWPEWLADVRCLAGETNGLPPGQICRSRNGPLILLLPRRQDIDPLIVRLPTSNWTQTNAEGLHCQKVSGLRLDVPHRQGPYIA